jgi:hypothetical protein
VGGLEGDVDVRVAYFGSTFLMHGITGVRDAGGEIHRLRAMDSIGRAMPAVMPRMIFSGDKIGPDDDMPDVAGPRTIAEVRTAIDERQRLGASFVKLTPAYPNALLAGTLRECAARRVACVAHVPLADTALWLGASAGASYEHLFGLGQQVSRVPAAELFAAVHEYHEPTLFQRVMYKLRLRKRPGQPDRVLVAVRDTTRDREFFRRLAASGAWFTPTLLLHHLLTHSVDLLPSSLDERFTLEGEAGEDTRTPDQERAARNNWALWTGIARAMWQGGVNLLAGTDFGNRHVPGAALHAEMVLLQQAGIPAPDVLRMATLNPARFLHATDTTGTVATGKVADLVVLRGNPLDDIAHVADVEMVMTRGVLLNQDALARMAMQSSAAVLRLRAALHPPKR